MVKQSVLLVIIYICCCIGVLNCDALNPLKTNRLLSTVHNVTAPAKGGPDAGHQ